MVIMSMDKDYQKFLVMFSMIALGTILFNPTIIFAEIDSSKPPMEMDWKQKDARDGTYWNPRDGDRILVFGSIHAGYDATFEIGDPQAPVGLTIKDPVGNLVGVDQVDPYARMISATLNGQSR